VILSRDAKAVNSVAPAHPQPGWTSDSRGGALPAAAASGYFRISISPLRRPDRETAAHHVALGRDGLGEPMDNRSDHGDDGADQRRSAALIGLIIILALAIAGVVLVRELRERSRLEDCLMSGRTNCAPIEVPLRR
jgi:hypothetical protein